MTNFEKYKDKLLEVGNPALIKGRLCVCDGCRCRECAFYTINESCRKDLLLWLYAEALETDWTKVPVDAKVRVSLDGKNWYCRHFAKYEDGKVWFWADGKTSFSAGDEYDVKSWQYAELVEE